MEDMEEKGYSRLIDYLALCWALMVAHRVPRARITYGISGSGVWIA